MKLTQYLCISFLLAACSVAQAKSDIGWLENVAIYPGNLQVKAKIDSGAQSSSLHCQCIQLLDKKGQPWVSFTVTNYQGEKIELKRKVERISTIKRHFGQSQERIVIKLGVCLGNVYKEAEVNLVDRSGLNYQMLIGRNFLAGDFLIDSEETYTTTPNCTVTD